MIGSSGSISRRSISGAAQSSRRSESSTKRAGSIRSPPSSREARDIGRLALAGGSIFGDRFWILKGIPTKAGGLSELQIGVDSERHTGTTSAALVANRIETRYGRDALLRRVLVTADLATITAVSLTVLLSGAGLNIV